MNKFTISPCNLLTLIKGYGNFQKHDIYLFEGEKPLGCCILSLTRVPVPFLILPRVLISKCWLMDRTKIKEEVPLVFSLSVRLTWFGTDSRNGRWAAQLSMYYHSEDQSRDQNFYSSCCILTQLIDIPWLFIWPHSYFIRMENCFFDQI